MHYGGREVLFRQVIDGQPVRQGGRVFFSSDGAVTRLRGNLINTQSLNAGDILILAPEAKAIAVDVAARYAENINLAHPDRSDVPVTLTALSAEMGYDLDSDSNLVRLWNVEVGIDGPAGDVLRVSISPETGEVVRVGSVRVFQTGPIFVVCDAGKAIKDGKPSTESIDGKAIHATLTIARVLQQSCRSTAIASLCRSRYAGTRFTQLRLTRLLRSWPRLGKPARETSQT